jgi:peroxiredoxin Q/BCP
MTVSVGDVIPEFCLPDANNTDIFFPQKDTEFTVLYFYPKDSSPGCTTEAKDFSGLLPGFAKLDVKVYGISKDTVKSHATFIEKQSLAVPLLSDTEHTAIDLFGVWVPKKLYGREYMGVDRSTFVIDSAGKIVAAWRNVRVKGHAAEVLQKVTELHK